MMTTMTSMMRMMTRMLTMLLLLLLMMRRRKMRTMRMRMSHGATEAQLKCSFKPLARFKVRRVLQFHPLQSLQYCCTLPLAEHEVKIWYWSKDHTPRIGSLVVTACLPNLAKLFKCWRSIVTLGQKWWFLSPTGKLDAMALFLDPPLERKSRIRLHVLVGNTGREWWHQAAWAATVWLSWLVCIEEPGGRLSPGHQVAVANLAGDAKMYAWYLNVSFVIFKFVFPMVSYWWKSCTTWYGKNHFY